MTQAKKTADKRLPEDPLLRRMLATHIHCGEPMELVTANTTPLNDAQGSRSDGALSAYRCSCGFTFDKT